MFQRLLLHLLQGNRARLTVAMLALVSGGAVISALMNLDLDIQHQLTQEFRSLGANLVISARPNGSSVSGAAALIDEAVVEKIEQEIEQKKITNLAASPDLYLVARAGPPPGESAVVAGTWLDRMAQMQPSWKITGAGHLSRADMTRCVIGSNVARRLDLSPGSDVELSYQGRSAKLSVAAVAAAGGPEDNQIFVNLPVAQKLAGVEGEIELIQLSVAGSADQIRGVAEKLQSKFPALAVKPIPQITEAEGKLLKRIRFLILSTGLLILVLTALCVLATMAALAMERRKDVGLMKALGGSIQKVAGLFFAEAAVLGGAGGILGYALGMALSAWMGRRVFAASISPRWEVLPVTIALMLVVALAGALPLRLLGNVRPAVILRGE